MVLMMKAVWTSETSVNFNLTRRYIPEDSKLHLHFVSHFQKRLNLYLPVYKRVQLSSHVRDRKRKCVRVQRFTRNFSGGVIWCLQTLIYKKEADI
jgi:hypothetical protein